MAKAQAVTNRSISDPKALAGFAKFAGWRHLARGNAAKAYAAGLAQRVVITEASIVDRAAVAHDSEGYQAALRVIECVE
jgi:uncharacterized protein (DUF1330 family)